jgi:hypothetical protein
MAVRTRAILKSFFTRGLVPTQENFGDLIDSSHNLADDVQWDDLRFPATQTRRGSNELPHFDFENIGFLFPQNDATEKIYIIAQMPHAYKIGTNIRPHIHFAQDEAELPVFKIEYKWYDNGAEIPAAYTPLVQNAVAFSRVSGNILQIAKFPEIDGSGITGVSSILDIRVYRDDNVVSGDVLYKEFDIHYRIDSNGSNDEYQKQTI